MPVVTDRELIVGQILDWCPPDKIAEEILGYYPTLGTVLIITTAAIYQAFAIDDPVRTYDVQRLCDLT